MCTQPLKMTPEILTFEENRHGWFVDHSVDKIFPIWLLKSSGIKKLPSSLNKLKEKKDERLH